MMLLIFIEVNFLRLIFLGLRMWRFREDVRMGFNQSFFVRNILIMFILDVFLGVGVFGNKFAFGVIVS